MFSFHCLWLLVLVLVCHVYASTLNLQWGGNGRWESPEYPWIFQTELLIAPPASPILTQNINGTEVSYYELSVDKFQQQIYPNLGKANLAGYNGRQAVNGPTFRSKRGTEAVVRLINNNDLSSSMHFHGAWTRSPWDGWANNMIQPGQFKDYYWTMTNSARTMWYHDHADHHTAVDAYYGQSGFHIIYDDAEESLCLPSGNYDIPLSLIDKMYQSNGDLVSPEGNTINFFGDVIQVNGLPWPYLNVEPRKYRLRWLNSALSRPFTLYFHNDNTNTSESFQVIASDGGLFNAPVTTTTLDIAMGERYEIVFDFAGYTSTNITVMNSMPVPDINEYDQTDLVMRFVVGDTVTDGSNNEVAGSLGNPSTSTQEPPQPARATIDHTFNFQNSGGAWTINGVTYDDPGARILARPPMGTVENWQLRYAGGPGVHPVHIHLIDFQIVSRTGGSRGVLPYESAGLKDVVLLEPGETVNVVAIYGPWNGLYQFHCHNLVHEDHEMMDVFNVTAIEDLGYNLGDVLEYDDPQDPRYDPQDYDAQKYGQDYITQTLLPDLVGSDAYRKLSEVQSAESAYYTTQPYGESATPGPTAADTVDSEMPTATASTLPRRFIS